MKRSIAGHNVKIPSANEDGILLLSTQGRRNMEIEIIAMVIKEYEQPTFFPKGYGQIRKCAALSRFFDLNVRRNGQRNIKNIL